MVRAVVDPNVFVSAQISSSGPPARIARAADQLAFEVVVSAQLLSELHDVLMRPRFRRYMTEGEVEDLVADLREKGTGATEGEIERTVPEDPRDDYLVALAHASNAEYLISGDPHLPRRRTKYRHRTHAPPIRRTLGERKFVEYRGTAYRTPPALITDAVTGEIGVPGAAGVVNSASKRRV